MKQLTAILLAVALVAAFTFVSGCTGTNTGDVTHLRIGYQPSTHQVAHVTAMEKGWWQEDLAPFGITQVTDYNFPPTGAPEMQAMLSGDLDIAYVGAAPPFIAAVSTGLDAKIIAAVQTQGSDLVLRNEVPYTGPADLVGKKIATFPPGTIQDTILRSWLEENGVDPPASVTIVAMDPAPQPPPSPPARSTASSCPHPSPSIIAAEGTGGRTVVQSGEMMKDHACCVLVASGSLIREHPEIVEQIVKTHIRATEYNLEHPPTRPHPSTPQRPDRTSRP